MFMKLEVYNLSTISDYTTNNFYSLWRFRPSHVWDSLLATPSSEQWPLNIQFLKKAADGGWNVEVSRHYQYTINNW